MSHHGRMTGAGLAAWREAAGWTQAEAAGLLSVTRETVSRSEKAADKPISRKLADAVEALGGTAGMEVPAAVPAATVPARQAKASKASTAGALHLRTFGRTAAECRAIREARAERVDKSGRTVNVPLVPLVPDWTTVGRRVVNAAIPSPLDRDPPSWAGPRGVVSADGHVYDYEAAHRMTAFV